MKHQPKPNFQQFPATFSVDFDLKAASSTAATTFTTAMSFFANLASVLRPLREFGFFMGVCVQTSGCWAPSVC